METLRINIINPGAKKLLKDLAELDLIKIVPEKKTDFSELLNKFRSKPGDKIELEDITKEVEAVRKSRYEQ